jgi:hypothetical protein
VIRLYQTAPISTNLILAYIRPARARHARFILSGATDRGIGRLEAKDSTASAGCLRQPRWSEFTKSKESCVLPQFCRELRSRCYGNGSAGLAYRLSAFEGATQVVQRRQVPAGSKDGVRNAWSEFYKKGCTTRICFRNRLGRGSTEREGLDYRG